MVAVPTGTGLEPLITPRYWEGGLKEGGGTGVEGANHMARKVQ